MERDGMEKEMIQHDTCECCETDAKCEIAQEQQEQNQEQEEQLCCCEQGNDGDSENIDELKQKLASAEQKCEEYLAIAQRIQADFENYKRRNKDAIANAYRDGTLDTIGTLLPVLDNLERALESCKNSTSEEGKAIFKGIEMVIKQFVDIMAKMGIEEIEALNKPFDPNYHNAVMQVEAENEEQKNKVVEVLQKGYKQKDRVIRYSMVKVAN